MASTLLAVGLGIFVTRRAGAEFLPLSRAIVNIGQTFPPVAVLALAVPVMGFGGAPTLLALFLYGLLPIFENTLSGLGEVPPEVPRGVPPRGCRYLTAEVSHLLHAWRGAPAGWGGDYPGFGEAWRGFVDGFRQGFGYYHQSSEDPLPGLAEPLAYLWRRR